MRRLDIGIIAYHEASKLAASVDCIKHVSGTNWRLLIVDNTCGADGGKVRDYIETICALDSRITARFMPENVGYAGGVNEILAWSETEYTAYVDHDAYVQTIDWDEILCRKLDAFHEIGMIFPNGGPYPIDRGQYTEVLWGVGYCWIMSRLCASDLKADGKTERGEVFDTSIGHQNEADACQRVRMAGYRCAAVPGVTVQHDATATSNPASVERINRGVVQWVTKWNRYFNGKGYTYHSPNVTRFEDWPPNALYLEEYYRKYLPRLNEKPEIVAIDGREFDLIRVPRYSGFYRGRII
jgi:glycosyltransferase involved in cell wall biosynthesis